MYIRFESSGAAIENGASPVNITLSGDGPDGYEFVQLTYSGLRISPDGDHVAYIELGADSDRWYVLDKPNGQADGRWFSDIVIG